MKVQTPRPNVFQASNHDRWLRHESTIEQLSYFHDQPEHKRHQTKSKQIESSLGLSLGLSPKSSSLGLFSMFNSPGAHAVSAVTSSVVKAEPV